MTHKFDVLIIGCGIIGLTIAHKLQLKYPKRKILIIDKEEQAAFHASRRNSGVLHAGFYYTADTLKAKLTVDGNAQMKNYCEGHGLELNRCGKLVVAKNADELQTLYELEKRAKVNGVKVQMITDEQAKEYDPNVKTHEKALWSPDTASINPLEVCLHLYRNLEDRGVTFLFDTAYVKKAGSKRITTTKGDLEADRIINCAGLYADRIAQDYGFGERYTMMPFKGLYLKYTKNKEDIRTNIYPVPDLRNPFLGVHFTKTVDGSIKIGPTAIPALWRENYKGFKNFNFKEMKEILRWQAKLFKNNSFGFRQLAFDEIKKYHKRRFIKLAGELVDWIDPQGFTQYTEPGIRAQLLDKKTLKLVYDFTIEADEHSIHILNAVSPALTCSFAFADLVIGRHIQD